VVPKPRHVHEHELQTACPAELPRLPGMVGSVLRTLHHLIRLTVLDEDPAAIRPPPGHLRRSALPKSHVRLVDPLIERRHLLVLGRGGCGVPLAPERAEEPSLPV